MMASTIAEKLGFTGQQNIQVESLLGKGSTFQFFIEDKMLLDDSYQSSQSDSLSIPEECVLRQVLPARPIRISIYNKSRHQCEDTEYQGSKQ